MTENERLTEKTAGCFGYDLKNLIHKTGEFADYNAFYSYNMAVKRLGEYEEIGTVEEFKALKEKNEPAKVTEHETPHFVHWQCGNCGAEFYSGQKFCDECGHPADWGDLLK